jgi:uncharacterized protein (TIGR03086 family)
MEQTTARTAVLDLGAAARELTRLVTGVRDDQLGNPTPCPDYALGDLVEHVHGLALAFTWAARKEIPPSGARGPSGDASRLPEDWRDSIAERLVVLADAWRDEMAWTGTAHIAGFDAPAPDVGVTALNELVVHGWDVARSSGETLRLPDESLEPCARLMEALATPEAAAARNGAFGPVVPLPSGSPLLDRVIAGSGRDPRWTGPRAGERPAAGA